MNWVCRKGTKQEGNEKKKSVQEGKRKGEGSAEEKGKAKRDLELDET
jgi:hypothetical protein